MPLAFAGVRAAAVDGDGASTIARSRPIKAGVLQ